MALGGSGRPEGHGRGSGHGSEHGSPTYERTRRHGAACLVLVTTVLAIEHGTRSFPWISARFEPFALVVVKSVVLLLALVGAVMLGVPARGLGLARVAPEARRETLAVVVCAIAIGVVLAQRQDVRAVYPLYGPARSSLGAFFVHTAFFSLYAFAWEAFFRGVVLFGLAPLFGRATLVVHAVAFTAAHVGIGKPLLEIALAFPGGLLLGVMALRARSFVGPFLAHAALAMSVNVACIAPKLW